MNQRTLANPIKAKGIGLHTGHESIMTLRPAPPNTGIVFRRVDCDPVIEFKVSPEIVGETMLCTTIVKDQPQGRVKIATIEHLMSALAGVGIDNVFIDITSDEVPIMDGSSSHFIFLLQSAGVEIQPVAKRFIRILKSIRVENDKGGSAEFNPYNGFRLNFSIEFDHPAFSTTAEKMTLEFSSTSYFKEVSRARTFGFMKDMEMLRQRNLALGASLENAIGLDDQGVMNVEGLRDKDEFVRHKILDAVGDLYMIGHPIIGEFTAHKSGHALNNQLLRALQSCPEAYEIVSFDKEPSPIQYGSSKILV
ncbi:MAG: UDP-3-O-acyl-N-acetylglucosamine deacetylase [Thiomicrorhabdus chilensis]|uniref:UDP-3-O-acyl-N-acetylglucosamine deacetylase n=1 Tax=Thiomicrorhabdus chilensis TaxID=63656 RepID=UPI0004170BFD|nr:UDP-3-O-acyl-N-acetylglucosamine deacetylase [Thiomicrorhabdus chilensis]MDX1346706.1 UDP-3-O-acyl-N-acetylglucosamine deacetylase [Thiomicrorhabdus chilensis]